MRAQETVLYTTFGPTFLMTAIYPGVVYDIEIDTTEMTKESEAIARLDLTNLRRRLMMHDIQRIESKTNKNQQNRITITVIFDCLEPFSMDVDKFCGKILDN